MKLVHILHVVNTERFQPECEPHPAVDPDRFTLLHVGRLVSRKHVDPAINALNNLEQTNIELLIAGAGIHEARLKNLVERLGMTNQVSFFGFIPDEEPPSLCATSNGFLFLSRYEGFGLTFLKAIAAGTPVIGTSVGGFPDIVTDGQGGLLIERTAEDVTQAIDTLADTPERVKKMTNYARKLAESRTCSTVVSETEQVYQTLQT